MIPPIYQALKANPALVTKLSQTINSKAIFKVFPWAEAMQSVTAPYVTYGVYNGLPQNVLDRTPLVDDMGTQIDIWGKTAAESDEIATMIRDILEPLGHMTNFDNATRDEDTKLFRTRLDFDFFVDR